MSIDWTLSSLARRSTVNSSSYSALLFEALNPNPKVQYILWALGLSRIRHASTFPKFDNPSTYNFHFGNLGLVHIGEVVLLLTPLNSTMKLVMAYPLIAV